MISHSKTSIDETDLESVLSSLKSRKLTTGNVSDAFSELLSDYLGLEFINLTSSGTMAFLKILIALEIKKDDEILIPNFICNSIIDPILFLGAKPIIYDNKKDCYLSDFKHIIKRISKKTKVILVNHTFGFAFKEIDILKKEIKKEINIIEDCCHAISSKSKIGSYKISQHSLCSFYSFNATKLIGTGEGGAIATSNKEFHEKISKIKIGDKLSDLSCSLGISQLKRIDEFIEKRKFIAEKYFNEFNNYLNLKYFNEDSIYYRYPIIVEDNTPFLNDKEISFRLGVDKLINSVDFPNSANLLKKIVSIPLYPSLKNNEILKIIEATKSYLNGS